MTAQPIDLDTWPRRDHFRLFQSCAWPYFSLSLEHDVTAWRDATRRAGHPFHAALVHRICAAANDVEAFRTRIRGEAVVRHDRVHPSVTVPWRTELFNFCVLDFEPDLAAFVTRCVAAIAEAEAADRLLLDEPDRDDMLFLSCLPWFGFTGVTHPVIGPGDAIPRISWGRLGERDGRALLPMNFQLHHGLADGRHVAEFLARFDALEAPL